MDDACKGKDSSFRTWVKLDDFHEQVRPTEGGEEFVFYDGAPFATGLPYYGHILAGTVKDVVTRHQSIRARHVSQRFGWDCHGLPVELEIALRMASRRQVFDLGIDKYNGSCRSIVTKYVSVVTRSGRWIDFTNGYRTIDLKFKENVWWVFAQLREKDLIYKGQEQRYHNWLEGSHDWAVSRSRFWDTPLFLWMSQDGEKIVLNSIKKLEKLSGVKEQRYHNWLEGSHDWAVSRSRFWGTPLFLWMSQDGEEIILNSIKKLEKLSGVKVLVTICVMIVPFTPFITEVLYQNLRKVSSKSEESIHFCKFPTTIGVRDDRVEQSVNRMVTIIDLARNICERHNKALRTPLKEMMVVHPDNEFLEEITAKLEEYVMEEINVKIVTPCNYHLMYGSLRAEPNFSVLGKRLGKDVGKVPNFVKKMTKELIAFEKSGEISFFGHLDDIKWKRGIDKQPFQLPDFGVEKQKAYVEEDSKKLKQKQWEHVQPKIGNTVTFFVKVEGKSICLQQNLSTMTTKELVEHVCAVKGIQNYDSYAVYNGKVLCDNTFLSDYNVCSNSTIEVRVRGRAGRERQIHCTTFHAEMEGVDRFIDIKLPKTLKNNKTGQDIAKFLSESCQYYARQVLITLCRVHFRKKCFYGKFDAEKILFHEGRAVFDKSCIEEDFTEDGCKLDFHVIAQLFTLYFKIDGEFPLYVSDLVQYLLRCPFGFNSNSVEAIALLVNHPALISFMERIAQITLLDAMVDRLTEDQLFEFAKAVGSDCSWGEEVATNIDAMLHVLKFDPLEDEEDADVAEKQKGKAVQGEQAAQVENAYYTEDPRSCLKFGRNYFKHAKKILLLAKIEAAFSLNLEGFLPTILRDIVQRFERPSTFNIAMLLGDIVADRKRKEKSVHTENIAGASAPPAKRSRIRFSLNVKKK